MAKDAGGRFELVAELLDFLGTVLEWMGSLFR